ncbi:MAG TPA: transglutaminase-like cysteine peptidase [Sphingomicrobium sp.]|nr:transglutaminase-like cysteine peptidase [Sphingomicrobium sp.]
MKQGLYMAAIAGACMAAAAPAWASSGDAAATPSSHESDQLIIVQGARRVLARPASPDVFGTAALDAGVTFYDARFRRVAAADARDPVVTSLAAPLAGLDPVAKLDAVQQVVNRRVRWAHDLDGMGVADFWANAGETLRRRVGDSEDIAIAKMQVLKAAGFDSKDLYLSVGRDKQHGAHVLLLARTGSGFFVLDDRHERLVTPSQHGRFTPIMTLGQGMSWIHGRRIHRVASSGMARANAK